MMSLLDDLKSGYMEAQGPGFHINNLAIMKISYEAEQFKIIKVNG